jgi:uncharacterized protein (TIGR03083 family)
MYETDQAPSKQELRAEMDAGLARFLTLIDGYSDEQMVTPTDAAGWTVRDHLTHLAAWADGIAALLRREDRWAAMGLTMEIGEEYDKSVDAMNAEIAQQQRHLTPAEARARLIAAHEQVVAAMDALSDAELAAPYGRYVAPFTSERGHPVFGYVIGNTSHHYEEHAPWIEAIVRGEG